MARKTKEEVLEKKVPTKATKKTAANKKTAAKNVVEKTNTKSTVKSVVKKTNTKKTVKTSSTKKTPSKKESPSTNKKNTKKTTTSKTRKKVSSKKVSKNIYLNVPEYYDLPYRYNKTVVKVLAQNPNTLFVYWDISDEDRLNFEKQYGDDFFTRTRPVLVIHNLTDNYTFEVDINDFANNWYVNVNDTKCKYFVELGRRTNNNFNNNFINKPVNYLNIAFSNTIEIPNDHILFFKENDKIYFKNIKTNKITEKVIKTFNSNLHNIYKTYRYSLSKVHDRFDFKNPSSQNPTSNFL